MTGSWNTKPFPPETHEGNILNTISTETETIMKDADPVLEQFGRFERDGAAGQPAWLYPVRKAGLARFAELGFPTRQHEDWRFTNVEPIAQRPFHPVWESNAGGVTSKALQSLPFARLEGHRLVFVDGHFSTSLSTLPQEENGVTIAPLSAAWEKKSNLLQRHLARHPGNADNSFASLNDAFFADGALIHVPKGKSVSVPVQLLFLSTTAEPGAVSHPRVLVVAEEDSRVTVLENYASLVDGDYWTNAVTELVVGDAAVVEHARFQDESPQAFHVSSVHASMGRDSRLWSHSIATGAKLSRVNIRTSLDGSGLECVLNGLYLTRDEQVADHHMVVNHAKPNCASHEYFNGILDDHSRGVFHGRILVRQEAQKTDAKQTNKNLLLSDDATANTKPQLEIYADDVKCTHGATVGQLNDESIFYLRARGVGEEMARRMLIHAFAGEIIERVQHSAIREEMDQLIWDRLEENEHIAVRG